MYSTEKAKMISMQDSEQLAYWQEKRFKTQHWYNPYNPVISVDLIEISNRILGRNGRQEEIQLELNVYQQRIPEKHENLLMALSDAFLRAVQHWVTTRKVPLKTQCYLTLHGVEPLALPMTTCLAVLTNIPVFTFFPWSPALSRKTIAMFDAMSFNMLLAKLCKPTTEMKLVITGIHN